MAESSCVGASVVHSEPEEEVQMSPQDNEALVRRFFDEAYNKRNLTRAAELLAEDCVLHSTSEIQGSTAWKMYATAWLTAFPDDLSVSVDDAFVAGDKVAARWTAQGTHNGPLRGVAPTGRWVKSLGVGLFYFSGGKVREVWGLTDALGMMQQIGAIPPQ